MRKILLTAVAAIGLSACGGMPQQTAYNGISSGYSAPAQTIPATVEMCNTPGPIGSYITCEQARLRDAIACANGATQFCPNTAVSNNTANIAHTPLPNTTHIPLQRTSGGSLVLEASINGSPLFPLILDSGADSMVLPLNLFMALAQHGYLTRDSDQYLGDVQLGLAGGSATSGAVIRIRSLTLGNITVHDVICTIMKSGQPLLGQSVLSKFHSVTINNDANTLDISEREAS